MLLLSVRNECPNIAHTDDEESDGLEKEKDEVMVVPKCNVVASTGEEVGCNTKLQNMQPASILKFSCKS